VPTLYPPDESASDQDAADDRDPSLDDLPARVTEIVRPPLADEEAHRPDDGGV
jgi:hypothetical protein